jgi:thiamine-monophosphate kinase
LQAFDRPVPLLDEGRELAPLVTAMMDVSDGLLLDIHRMGRASGVAMVIDSSAVPVAVSARRSECMCWGDDYELLFTLPSGSEPPVPATRIGTVEPRGEAPLVLDGKQLVAADGLGYQHG